MSHAESDFRLVEMAKKGDRDAFRRIVERHEAAVAAVVIGMLGAGDEADDVGQETFVRFYRSLSKFRGDAALRTYLSRIAMNLSLNALKRRKREAGRTRPLESEVDELGLADPQMGPDGMLERDETQRAVRAAIAHLDEKHRSVISLRMLQGMSTKETADVLGLPQGTVLSRLSRAMKKLEAELEPWMHEE